MTEPRMCPTCKAEIPPDAPPGVCPFCALRAGYRQEPTTRPGPDASHTPPLSPEELSRRLPELEDFSLIGPGGMGTVYRARHRTLDRPVAVKVIHADLRERDTFADRFIREARTLARLDHPSIVKVYDFGQRDGLSYLIMELVDGVTLRQAIDEGAIDPKEALALVPRICEALQYAHDQGVVHRDIKPDNILLDRQGALKIADFGLAKLVGTATEPRLTRTEQVMGTPHYMAPEQIETPTQVDHRADIYSLGVVFYEMLTGELPVGRFPLPSNRVAIDVRLDRVVLRTLEKQPGLRYQRARDLKTEVEALSDPDHIPAEHARRFSAERDGASDDDLWGSAYLGSTGDESEWESEMLWSRRSRGYEYRSEKTLWGLPLIHVLFSADRMGVARGVVAIGERAVGLVAVGGMAVGGITLGGLSFGLISLGGIALGLLVGLGGLAFGGVAVGGVAMGLAATGEEVRSFLELSAANVEQVRFVAWAVGTLASVVAVAAVLMWLTAIGGRARGKTNRKAG